jgi:hypothetical protein
MASRYFFAARRSRATSFSKLNIRNFSARLSFGARRRISSSSTRRFTVPSELGIEIYVRNKRPADERNDPSVRSCSCTAPPIPPTLRSISSSTACRGWTRGYDVYLLDLRGYGRSTRPKEMDEAPEANPPMARGTAASPRMSSASV